jgi:hypothetical protein
MRVLFFVPLPVTAPRDRYQFPVQKYLFQVSPPLVARDAVELFLHHVSTYTTQDNSNC